MIIAAVVVVVVAVAVGNGATVIGTAILQDTMTAMPLGGTVGEVGQGALHEDP